MKWVDINRSEHLVYSHDKLLIYNVNEAKSELKSGDYGVELQIILCKQGWVTNNILLAI